MGRWEETGAGEGEELLDGPPQQPAAEHAQGVENNVVHIEVPAHKELPALDKGGDAKAEGGGPPPAEAAPAGEKAKGAQKERGKGEISV